MHINCFRSKLILCLVLILAGCSSSKKTSRRSRPAPEPAPADPSVTEAFVTRVAGAGAALANKPLIDDLDPRPGNEAIMVTHKNNRSYQVTVARGDNRVLAQAPLGGRILANASIQAVGEFQVLDFWGKEKLIHLLPVETKVLKHNKPICGFLAMRYRADSLSVIGEFGCKCWRKEAGGDGVDPKTLIKALPSRAETRIETIEETGKRIYRWDESQQAFLSSASPKAAPKKAR